MFNYLSLIFVDNPIGRCYLKVYLEDKNTDLNIVYLSKYSKFSLIRKNNFYKNNYYPILFKKYKIIEKFSNHVEEFFGLNKNFLFEMYDLNLLDKFKNVNYVSSNSINEKNVIQYLKKSENKSFLVSHQEILKNVFTSNKDFYHIHPGYLPLVKGADGSLHSIYNYNHIGYSFFKMSEKIDQGEIIYRNFLKFKNFSFNFFNEFDIDTIYRIWFSFFDPAIRAHALKKVLKQKISLSKTREKLNKNEKFNYFTFMNANEKKLVFDKIFL